MAGTKFEVRERPKKCGVFTFADGSERFADDQELAIILLKLGINDGFVDPNEEPGLTRLIKASSLPISATVDFDDDPEVGGTQPDISLLAHAARRTRQR